MEFLAEKVIVTIIAIICPLLTMLDLPGNTIMLMSGFAFAFFNEALYFNGRLLCAMILVYILGEFWEFCVELFGIRRQKVSWFAVFLISFGGFAGTFVGTMFFPVFGSLIGSMLGAYLTAFAYELIHTGVQKRAIHLAWEAAKMQFLGLVGKLAAGIALAVLLVKQVICI